MTTKARQVFARAREMDPTNPSATFYEAIALEQAGDKEQAHDLLISRLEQAAGPAAWMEPFIAQANRIGAAIGREPVSLASFAATTSSVPGPTQEDVATASEMSEAEKDAFIRSMVDRLAVRLSDEPNDLDGWMRLGKAYRVLGEMDKARQSYETAERLAKNLAMSDPRRQAILEVLSNL